MKRPEGQGERIVQTSVTGRHMDLTPELRSYAETKAGKLTRFYDRIQTVDVILDGEGNGFEAEMIVKAERKHVFVAKEIGEDMYAAVDLVVDKVERQLRKHKEKLRNRKHPADKGQRGADTETQASDEVET